ncbi:hypothetical protein FACS1894137_15520 [Spirochaetia bacterium]|nr:hypothetical protein FACS1894137_15520 [Spirochaetia bacterium]
MLRVQNAYKTFEAGTPNENTVLRGLNLELAAGEFVSVIGSNGAGKSTLFNVIGGNIPLDRGSVTLDGEDITRKKARSLLHRRVQRIIRLICSTFGVNPVWLKTGRGPMFFDTPSEKVDEIIAIFKQLHPFFQDFFLNQLRQIYEYETNTKLMQEKSTVPDEGEPVTHHCLSPER